MPPVLHDNSPHEIACPKCKKKIVRTIGWFKGHNLTCPFCDCGLNSSQFRRDIDETNKMIADAWLKLTENFPKAG